MTDGPSLTIDPKSISGEFDRMVRQYLIAGTVAVSGTARSLERDLEAATRAAVPGKLWRAWQSSTYPRSGPAQNPVGTIWLKGNMAGRTGGAIRFWTQPGAIRGKQGQYLAIPLPAAGSPQGRGRMLTPAEWEARHNVELIPIFRPGKPGLLVAKGALNGRSGTYRPLTGKRAAADVERRGYARGEAIVPIFVLMPAVRFRNAFAIEPIVKAAEGKMVQDYLREVAALGR